MMIINIIDDGRFQVVKKFQAEDPINDDGSDLMVLNCSSARQLSPGHSFPEAGD